MFALEFQPGGVQRPAHRHTVYFKTRPKFHKTFYGKKNAAKSAYKSRRTDYASAMAIGRRLFKGYC